MYAKSRTLKRDINKGNTLRYTIAVTLAMRSHLFSYRTQKLSSSAPKILSWRRLGKIGRCCIQNKKEHQTRCSFFFIINRVFPRAWEDVAVTLVLVCINNSLEIWVDYGLLYNATYLLAQMNAPCCIQKEKASIYLGVFFSSVANFPKGLRKCRSCFSFSMY